MQKPFDMPYFRTYLAAIVAAWGGNLIYAAGHVGSAVKLYAPAPVAAGLIIFVILHGRRQLGGTALGAFVLIVMIVGWAWEAFSIQTGFPFGFYHYTEHMPVKLGHIPVSVLVAYAVMGYLSWTLARILLGRFDDHRPVDLVVHPLVAAVLMVFWDLCMEPLRSTIEGRWIWQDAGGYFGIPLTNFSGWLLVTWSMFFLFGLYLRRNAPAPLPREAKTAPFWLLSILMYLCLPVEYVINPIIAHVDGRGGNGIYQASALMTFATMYAAALLAFLKINTSFRSTFSWRVTSTSTFSQREESL